MRKLGAVLAYRQLSDITAITAGVAGLFDGIATERLTEKLARRVFGAPDGKTLRRGRDWSAIRALIRDNPELTADANAEALNRLDELERRDCQI